MARLETVFVALAVGVSEPVPNTVPGESDPESSVIFHVIVPVGDPVLAANRKVKLVRVPVQNENQLWASS